MSMRTPIFVTLPAGLELLMDTHINVDTVCNRRSNGVVTFVATNRPWQAIYDLSLEFAMARDDRPGQVKSNF